MPLGEIEEARARFQELLTAAETHGVPLGIAAARLGFGRIAHYEGRFEEAFSEYALAGKFYAEQAIPQSAAFAREFTGDVHDTRGDTAAALAEWREAERVYAEYRTSFELGRVRAKIAGRAA